MYVAAARQRVDENCLEGEVEPDGFKWGRLRIGLFCRLWECKCVVMLSDHTGS
jgi:hypothetical protein